MVIVLLIHAGNLPIDVTYYTLDGPGTATVGIPSDQFVVQLGPGTLGSPDVITPSDNGAGGTFSVVSVTLTDTGRVATFTYTAAIVGTITISVTDDGGLIDPPPIVLNTSAAVVEDIRHGPIVELHPAALFQPGPPSRWHRGAR